MPTVADHLVDGGGDDHSAGQMRDAAGPRAGLRVDHRRDPDDAGPAEGVQHRALVEGDADHPAADHADQPVLEPLRQAPLGRPERAEESERAFYRSMEELVPIIEKSGLKVFIDPHPDDFVENGLAAWRVIRGINSANFGMVYVASHTFHMGNDTLGIMREVGDRIGIVHVSDTMDHTRSHGLRYITNPPGNAVRVHQHLKMGDGDVNWDEFFGGLKEIGFLDNPASVMCSSVFAENENAREMSIWQREAIEGLVAKHK